MRLDSVCGSLAALCIAGLGALPLLADAADLTALAALQSKLDQAVLSADADALQTGREQALALGGAGEGGFMAAYLAAYASYRLGEIYEGERNQARDALNSCIDELEEVIDGQTGVLAAEGHALLAACYGSSTTYYRPPRVIMRGTRAQRHLDAALAAAADNPRVILQDAISDYSRPAMFGGDIERAGRKLREAADRFAEGAAVPEGYPAWGEAETWLYIGRVETAAGNTGEARSALEKALLLAPGYRAAEEALAAL